MPRKYFFPHLLLALLILALPAYAADPADPSAPLTRGELQEALREILRENPDLILTPLRENSEVLLEIAQQGSENMQLRNLRPRWERELAETPKEVSHERPIKGNPEAPVTIIVYSDYTCPYCGTDNHIINQALAARKDVVRMIFKNLPLKSNPLSRMAAEYVTAAFMQDEAKGWAMHDAIFAEQARFMDEGEGFLRTTALSLDLDLQKLSADSKSRAVQNIIDEDMLEAREVKAGGTPFHLVGNISIPGTVPLRFILEAIDLAASAQNK